MAHILAKEVLDEPSAFAPVKVPGLSVELSLGTVQGALAKSRANMPLEAHERTQVIAFRDWRNGVTLAEATNDRRIGSVMFAIRSCEDIGDREMLDEAARMRRWLDDNYAFAAPKPMPDAVTSRRIATRAARREDVLPNDWRAL